MRLNGRGDVYFFTEMSWQRNEDLWAPLNSTNMLNPPNSICERRVYEGYINKAHPHVDHHDAEHDEDNNYF